MLDFLKTLFRPQGSGATAKERLRLVLLSDHLSLAPDMIESLKADLFAVLSRYVEIDSQQAEVTFEHRDREVAMLASVPILRVLERPLAAVPDVVAEAHVAAVTPLASAEPVAETLPELDATPRSGNGSSNGVANATSGGSRARRRRRKNAAAGANGKPKASPDAMPQVFGSQA